MIIAEEEEGIKVLQILDLSGQYELHSKTEASIVSQATAAYINTCTVKLTLVIRATGVLASGTHSSYLQEEYGSGLKRHRGHGVALAGARS